MSEDFSKLFTAEEGDMVIAVSNLFNNLAQQEKEQGHARLAHGYETSAFMIKVHAIWLKAVGALVAKHIQPLTVKGNCLILTADNPVYAQEFYYMKDTILQEIRKDPELAMITTIKTKFQGEQKRAK